VLLWTSIGYVTWYVGYAGGGPPTSGPAVEVYLREQVLCYSAVEWLNDQYPHYRAWAEGCEGARYYARGLLISDAFSIGARDRVLTQQGTLPSAGILWERLRPLHVQWVIVPTLPRRTRAQLDARGLFRYETTAGSQEIFSVVPRLPGARRH
jgi:hypothetical protein